MLVGHKDKIEIFKRLYKKGELSHGYVFFGDDQVGKRTFALSLANLLEKGEFETPESILSETKVINPEGESIGIDAVREIKRFLSQKPIASKYRVLIINDAHKLTAHAQSSILKIAEEPPVSSLIILISPTIDSLLGTIQSRLQKIYFTRVSQQDIVTLLKSRGVDIQKANELAKSALGRPGRAVDALENEEFKRFSKLVKAFIKNPGERKDILQSLIKENDDVMDRDLIDIFVSHMMAELALDPVKNERALSGLCDRSTKIADFSTNKRLQLEAALWNL